MNRSCAVSSNGLRHSKQRISQTIQLPVKRLQGGLTLPCCLPNRPPALRAPGHPLLAYTAGFGNEVGELLLDLAEPGRRGHRGPGGGCRGGVDRLL